MQEDFVRIMEKKRNCLLETEKSPNGIGFIVLAKTTCAIWQLFLPLDDTPHRDPRDQHLIYSDR